MVEDDVLRAGVDVLADARRALAPASRRRSSARPTCSREVARVAHAQVLVRARALVVADVSAGSGDRRRVTCPRPACAKPSAANRSAETQIGIQPSPSVAARRIAAGERPPDPERRPARLRRRAARSRRPRSEKNRPSKLAGELGEQLAQRQHRLVGARSALARSGRRRPRSPARSRRRRRRRGSTRPPET